MPNEKFYCEAFDYSYFLCSELMSKRLILNCEQFTEYNRYLFKCLIKIFFLLTYSGLARRRHWFKTLKKPVSRLLILFRFAISSIIRLTTTPNTAPPITSIG